MRVSVSKAASIVRKSHPVAIPTETVWGLAAPLSDEKAIGAIFTLKNRPKENPLIIHLADPQDLSAYAQTPLPPKAQALMERFWPGPMTLVIPCNLDTVPALARANLPSAGFRIPRSSVTRELIREVGPLVAPSANLSGRPSATEMGHVEEDFGLDFPCLETEESCECGIESTILVYKEETWCVGRLGALSLEEIASCIGSLPKKMPPSSVPVCPGQKFRHYAPKAHLTLSRSPWHHEWKDRFDAVVGFSDRDYPGSAHTIFLGPSFSPKEAEKNLYKALRRLDTLGATRAWIDCRVDYTQEWEPLFDRLEKASSSARH